MKKVLFGAALAALAFASAPAFAQVTGYVDGSYTRAKAEIASVEGHADGMALTGALAAPLGAKLQLQAGLSYSDSNVGDGAWAGALHVTGAPTDQARAGAFISGAQVGGETGWATGVEGQYDFSRITLAGSVSYATVDSVDVDIWGVNTQARFFATDNFRVDADLGWASVDAGGGNADVWTMGVGAEAQVAGPLSVFVDYNHASIDDIDLKTDTVSIGLRYNFGGSLKDRDRSGANFVGAPSLLAIANF